MERTGRRQLLMGAGAGSVALAGLALPATAASASGGSEGDSLEGGWLITHVDTTGPSAGSSAQAVVTFANGGALASRDINPSGNAQLGAWEKTGDHRFAATFWDGFTDPTGLVFTIKIIVHGSWKGDHISGTFSVQFFGPQTGSANGTFQGTRIDAGE